MSVPSEPVRVEHGQTISEFLGMYAMCEGAAEEIGYAYMGQVPSAVVRALVGDRPWSGDQIADLLDAAIDIERLTFDDSWRERMLDGPFSEMPRYEIVRQGARRGEYHVVAEWRWATRVRNDLAHSLVIAIDGGGGPGGATSASDRRQLQPRSNRHQLRELITPFTHADLFQHMQRLILLYMTITRIGGQIGRTVL